MKKIAKYPAWILYILAIFILIFESKTAIDSARDGINLCLQSVIPSLFSFIFLSGILTTSLSATSAPFPKIITKLLRIPRGSELLVILGFLGGYPVGAQNICNSYCNGLLKSSTARRMLIFCNNAGPAFIFGIVTPQLVKASHGWYLWGILILSSLFTALLLPGDCEFTTRLTNTRQSASSTLTNAIKVMATICGWVIIFRVLLGFLERWWLQSLPAGINILISGLLELTNGCVQLKKIPCAFDRFAIGAFLLSVGGMCVTMQTATAAARLGMNGYLPGKVLGGCISYLICLAIQPVLFPDQLRFQHLVIGLFVIIVAVLCVIYLKKAKNTVAFCANV